MTVNQTTDAVLSTNTFDSPLSITPVFDVIYTNSVIDGTFSGQSILARNSIASVVDFEGLTKTVGINEARFVGARRVENLVPLSANLSVSFTVNANVLAGEHVISMGPGSGTATFGGSAGVTGTLSANASSRTAVQKTATDGVISITASVSALADLQIESVAGQANQEPSEYVSAGVLTEPWHGAGVDGVKYFATENGNTLGGIIVTEAVGAPISDVILKGYLAEGPRTNDVLNSTVMVTQDISTGTAARTLSFTGTGNITLTGTFSAILFGTGMSDRVSLTYIPTTGTLTLVVSGDVRVAQDEVGNFASSWIPTDGSPSAREIDLLTYTTVDNFDESQGTTIVTAEMLSWPNAEGLAIFRDPGISPLRMIPTNSGVESFDGTNTVIGPEGTPIGPMKMATRWSSGRMQVFSNGAAGAIGPYDGGFNITSPALFLTRNGWFGTMKKLSIYNTVLTQDQINTEIFVEKITAKWDISLDESGDILTRDFFDTALLVSLFAEKRALEFEVPTSNFRRGWIGNESFDNDFEIGSKIWQFEQSRITRDTINSINAAATDGLEWFITQGLVDNIIVDTVVEDGELVLNIGIFRQNSRVDKRFYDLWDNSGVTNIKD